MRRAALGLRWWWIVGVVWIAGYFALSAPLWRTAPFRRWVWGQRGSLLLVLLPPIAGLAWLLVVAPMLQSGVEDFSERRPAVRRARVATVLSWVPTVIFGLLMVQYGLVRLLGINDFGWFDGGYGLLLTAALLLSVVYGRMMSRVLVRRIRDAADRAGRCFGCNYDVSLSGDRCPECGTRRGGQA